MKHVQKRRIADLKRQLLLAHSTIAAMQAEQNYNLDQSRRIAIRADGGQEQYDLFGFSVFIGFGADMIFRLRQGIETPESVRTLLRNTVQDSLVESMLLQLRAELARYDYIYGPPAKTSVTINRAVPRNRAERTP